MSTAKWHKGSLILRLLCTIETNDGAPQCDYTPHHTASVMPAVVLVATMSRLGHWLKSCMLENTHTVPSHIRPVRAEEASAKLPSA